MNDCIFCKIIRGELPCHKVYEDDDVLAFMDINPIHKGHVLVIPKKHAEIILDLDDEILQKVIVIVKKLSKPIVKATGADGFNVAQSNGRDAGQEIDHVHFHIIPRFKDDGKVFDWPHEKYNEGEMQQYAKKINASVV